MAPPGQAHSDHVQKVNPYSVTYREQTMMQANEGESALEAAERLLKASRYRKACSTFASLAGTDGYRATANVGWGRALTELGNHDEAASHFEAAIAADPANDSAYDALAEIW